MSLISKLFGLFVRHDVQKNRNQTEFGMNITFNFSPYLNFPLFSLKLFFL